MSAGWESGLPLYDGTIEEAINTCSLARAFVKVFADLWAAL